MTKIRILALLAAIVLLAAVPAVVSAQQPPPPHVFVGNATISGVPAADGTIVTAWIDGGQAGAATVSDSDGSYVLSVEQPVGVAYSGKTVTFKIGGVDAAETATWEQGGAQILNITVGGPTPTATPAPVPTATQAPPATPTPRPTATQAPPATPTPEPTATQAPPATATPEPTATQAPPATAVPEPTATQAPPATATPEPTATQAPPATAVPEPTATQAPPATAVPGPTPTAPPNGGGGCSAPASGAVPLDGGWLLLGLVLPGLMLARRRGWMGQASAQLKPRKAGRGLLNRSGSR